MKKVIVLLVCCWVFLLVQSQESVLNITASAIPSSLKENADVVYRLDEARLEVTSASEYTLGVHQIITILNEEGAAFQNHRLFTDKFYKVKEVNIRVFDAQGMFRKSYTLKDFEKEAYQDGFSLYTDDKIMKLFTPAPGYPFTMDVQYRIQVLSYLELPNWFINYNRSSTELFRYDVTVPSALDIRYRTVNMSVDPKMDSLGNKKHYLWEAKNITAKKLERDSYEPAYFLPQVEVAPTEFNYDGYQGSFRSWKDFGEWNYKLYEEKSPFSQKRIDEIKSLIASATNNDDKIRILYRYMQQNMRYVSIQLGIGGFKPFPVKFVDEKKYGDCKALTNYMRNLLKIAGIDSYPALINAGNNKIPVDADFPSSVFNHVILCIPTARDTTWLECTSVHNVPGQLGPFTENKRALLLTENGGILVSTPKSKSASNLLFTNNDVRLNADGGAQIINKISGTGEFASFYYYLSQMKENEQSEALVKTFHYKNPDELNVTVLDDKNQTTLLVNLVNEKLYDFKTGNKYFFPIGISKMVNEAVLESKRESDYLFDYPYNKTDTTVFIIPAGFSPENIPANKELHTDYTSYKRIITFSPANNQLMAVSTLSLDKHVIPAARYNQVAQFFNKVKSMEEENLILVKQ